MNKRQKIIVSITGIFLVLLILIGLTYAYFLTRIEGNTNTKSISVTTADLKLVYRDGNGIISATNIQPNYTLDAKTFTVTNEGDTTVSGYVVIIEDVSITDVTTGANTTFVRPQDFVYTLTCISSENNLCDGTENSLFPMKNSILVSNDIDPGETHTYELILKYVDPGVDQSKDMNKALSAKVNIEDVNRVNPYSDNTDSLAYKMINNAMLNKNGTELTGTPLSAVGISLSGRRIQDLTVNIIDGNYIFLVQEHYLNNYITYADDYIVDEKYGLVLKDVHTCIYNECYKDLVGKYIYSSALGEISYTSDIIGKTKGNAFIFKIKSLENPNNNLQRIQISTLGTNTINESILTTTQDNYGTSYYYRGTVTDNYINYADMCWRIVRIQGDGSIKLVLASSNGTCDEEGALDTDTGIISTGVYGYKTDSYNNYILDYKNSEVSGMSDAFQSFQETELKDYLGLLKSGDWCIDDRTYDDIGGNQQIYDLEPYYQNHIEFSYAAKVREDVKQEYTLKCNGTNMSKFNDSTDMYVGTLTMDEIAYAGASGSGFRNNYYYLHYNSSKWWLLSPYDYYGDSSNENVKGSAGSFITNRGSISVAEIADDTYGYRPSVILKKGIEVSGEGTLESPYNIIEE